jgi:hypothetical protein
MRRHCGVVVALGFLVAGCGNDKLPSGSTPTATIQPGATFRVGVAEIVVASGDYGVPAGQYSLRMECAGNYSYSVRVASGASSGNCQSSTSTQTVGPLTGPGTATFTITAGYLRLTLQ